MTCSYMTIIFQIIIQNITKASVEYLYLSKRPTTSNIVKSLIEYFDVQSFEVYKVLTDKTFEAHLTKGNIENMIIIITLSTTFGIQTLVRIGEISNARCMLRN